MVKDTDIAWLAGLLDGEGCIVCFRINRKQSRAQLAWHLNLSMTDRDTVEAAAVVLRSISGDTVKVRSRVPKSGFSKRMQFVVDVSTKYGVLAALEMLHPYFRRLKLQSELVMSVMERAVLVKRYSYTALDVATLDVLKRLKRGSKEARAEALQILGQVTLSQADLGPAFAGGGSEGAETRGLTPKNNDPHERPAPDHKASTLVKAKK